MRWPKPFDYDQNLIPPEPNFFSTGFLMDKEDRYVISFLKIVNVLSKVDTNLRGEVNPDSNFNENSVSSV